MQNFELKPSYLIESGNQWRCPSPQICWIIFLRVKVNSLYTKKRKENETVTKNYYSLDTFWTINVLSKVPLKWWLPIRGLLTDSSSQDLLSGFAKKVNCKHKSVRFNVDNTMTTSLPGSPGLLMYMWMGLLLLSDCRKSSWAITRLATESSI